MNEETYKEVNDCRPQVIEHFIGQSQVVRRCGVAMEAAWNQGTKLPQCVADESPGEYSLG